MLDISFWIEFYELMFSMLEDWLEDWLICDDADFGVRKHL